MRGDPLSFSSLDRAHLFLSVRHATAALTLTAIATAPLQPLCHHRLHGLTLMPPHHRHASPAHSHATLMPPSLCRHQHVTVTTLLKSPCQSSLPHHVLLHVLTHSSCMRSSPLPHIRIVTALKLTVSWVVTTVAMVSPLHWSTTFLLGSGDFTSSALTSSAAPR